MPSKSQKQARLMRAVCHGWRPKGPGAPRVPRDVACEFMRADLQRKARKK